MLPKFYLQFLFKKLARPALPIFTGTLLAIFLFSTLSSFPDGQLHLKFYLSSDLGFFNRSVDVGILTHPDSDHAAGLIGVLSRFRVSNIIYNSEGETQTFLSFKEAVERQKKNGAKVYTVKSGDRVKIGDISVNFLWPISAAGSSRTNDLSIVSLVKFKDFEVLLPGDQEVMEAEKMLAAVDVPAVEVLKVAHHGSKNGLSRRILERLKPQLAIISAGKNNRYGHPHGQVLELLKEFTVRILRTDEEGTVEVASDGQSFWLTK